MAVRSSKPAFNIREKLKELERPIGAAGTSLIRSDTPQEAFNIIGAGRKNLLINGDFKISQRGDYSSAIAASHSTYYLDRWKTDISGPSATIQRQTVTLPDKTQTYSAKLAATSTVTSGYLQLQQFIEVFPYMQGRTVTFSAWVRSNKKVRLRMENTLTNYDSLTEHDGNGQWQFLSQTLILGSGFTSLRFGVIMWNSSGANTGAVNNAYITSGDYLEFANYQVEFGPVATPFEYRSIGEELVLCQRYYEKSYDIDIAPGSNIATNGRSAVYFSGTSDTAGNMITHVSFNVLKRGTPTITFYRNNGTVTMTTTQHGNRGFCPYANVGGNNISASFNGSWTASAEI
jgi:hypothetical protein